VNLIVGIVQLRAAMIVALVPLQIDLFSTNMPVLVMNEIV